MRMLVFSDIHGNLSALESVLTDAVQQGIDRAICLGDIVGYGPRPNECIELVRNFRNCRCICGNHDAAVLWDSSPYGMTKNAKESILWTMDQLSEENKLYLKMLPDRITIGDMIFAHANPYNPRGWRYVMERKYAMRTFGGTNCRHIFIGHSHSPLIITKKHWLAVTIEPARGAFSFSAGDTRRRIFNCGSVGQPRDKDPRACYLIVDTTAKQIEFHRIEYDIDKTARAIADAGLPSRLGKRLTKGV